MGIKDLQCIRHSPLFRVFYIDCPWVGQEKKFEIKALRWLENAILGLVFANTVFYKSTILLILEAEVTEKTSSRIQSPLLGPHWLGPKKNFHNKSSQVVGKCCLEIVFAYSVFHKRDMFRSAFDILKPVTILEY